MAKLEDLKEAWQSENGISEQRFEQIGLKVREGTELLQRVIFQRDMVESAISAFVCVGCFCFMFTAKNWIDWFGYAFLTFGGILIPSVLWWARKRSIATVSASNFRDFVAVEIDYLQRQVLILRRVAWWYVLPIYLGMILVTLGLHESRRREWLSDALLPFVLLVMTTVVVWVWWVNQKARKTQLEPLLRYYVEMQKALESNADSMLDVPGPPLDILQCKPRKPMSKRSWWIWVMIVVGATLAVVIAGVAIIMNFDRRTGIFIASTAPAVTLLMIVISGIGRRPVSD